MRNDGRRIFRFHRAACNPGTVVALFSKFWPSTRTGGGL